MPDEWEDIQVTKHMWIRQKKKLMRDVKEKEGTKTKDCGRDNISRK